MPVTSAQVVKAWARAFRCNLFMNREEALGLTGGHEALHDAQASSGRLMRVLRAIVDRLTDPGPAADFRHRDPIGALLRDERLLGV
jgi:hypothetical protein